jgi:hypothetical protein
VVMGATGAIAACLHEFVDTMEVLRSWKDRWNPPRLLPRQMAPCGNFHPGPFLFMNKFLSFMKFVKLIFEFFMIKYN